MDCSIFTCPDVDHAIYFVVLQLFGTRHLLFVRSFAGTTQSSLQYSPFVLGIICILIIFSKRLFVRLICTFIFLVYFYIPISMLDLLEGILNSLL